MAKQYSSGSGFHKDVSFFWTCSIVSHVASFTKSTFIAFRVLSTGGERTLKAKNVDFVKLAT